MTGPILIILIVVGLPVICGTIIILAAMLRKGHVRDRDASNAEDARIIQEMHQNLNKLEERIESIETILIENERMKGTLK